MDTLFAFIFLPLDSAVSLYAVLFSVLVLSGIGLPIPEEATLILGGYLAYLEFIEFWPTLYVLLLGIIVADVIGYGLGRFAGEWVHQSVLNRWWLSRVLLEEAKKYFEKHGDAVVIFSRPLLGVRVAVPILAGHFRMRFGKFILFDLIAAIPWTALLVFFSYYLGAGIDLITEIREIKYIIVFAFALAFLFYGIVKFLRNAPMRD